MLLGETVAVSVTGWPITTGLTVVVSDVSVAIWATVSFRAADVLPRVFVSPLYTAVSECEPSERPVGSDNVAVSVVAVPLRLTVPRAVVPSMNVTLPVGSP